MSLLAYSVLAIAVTAALTSEGMAFGATSTSTTSTQSGQSSSTGQTSSSGTGQTCLNGGV